MDPTLQELSDLVCLKYALYNKCMYGMRKLNTKSKSVNHKLRRDWTRAEKNKMIELLNQIMVFESEEHKFKYYKCLIYNRIAPLIN